MKLSRSPSEDARDFDGKPALGGYFCINEQKPLKVRLDKLPFPVEMRVRINLGSSAIPSQRSRRLNGGVGQDNPSVPKVQGAEDRPCCSPKL